QAESRPALTLAAPGRRRADRGSRDTLQEYTTSPLPFAATAPWLQLFATHTHTHTHTSINKHTHIQGHKHIFLLRLIIVEANTLVRVVPICPGQRARHLICSLH